MTRKTHKRIFALALFGVVILFAILAIREVLVRVWLDAEAVDPTLELIFSIFAFPTAACVLLFVLPQMLTQMFAHSPPGWVPKSAQARANRDRGILRSLGLLVEPAKRETSADIAESTSQSHHGKRD